MSQSDEHRSLVIQMVRVLEARYPKISVTADVQQQPRDPVPQIVDRFRPDVYASQEADRPSTIIAEAKTGKDIDRPHTREQLKAFISHLERKKDSLFILTVNGCHADLARTMLRILYQEIPLKNTGLSVFDGHDLWSLDLESGETWHLI